MVAFQSSISAIGNCVSSYACITAWLSDVLSSPQFNAAITHWLLFVPVLFVWSVYYFDILRSVGIRYFLTELPHHYEMQDGEHFLLRQVRLLRASPSFWTHFFLSLYIALFWIIALRREIDSEDIRVESVLDLHLTQVVYWTLVVSFLIYLAHFVKIRRARRRDQNQLQATIKGSLAGQKFVPLRSLASYLGELIRVFAAIAAAYFALVFAFASGLIAVINCAAKGVALIAFNLTEGVRPHVSFADELLAGIFFYVIAYAVVLLLAFAIVRLKVVGVIYLLAFFFVFMAIYAGFAFIGEQWHLPAIVIAVIYLAFIFHRRARPGKGELTFDGILQPSPDGAHLINPYDLPRDERLDPTVDDAGAIPQNNELVDIIPALAAWKQKAAELQEGDKPKMVLVGTSGGASLAAYWTGLVLDGLAGSSIKGIVQAIRVVAGASGGMVGAGYFTGMAPQIKTGGEWQQEEHSVVKKMIDDSIAYQRKKIYNRPIPRDLLTQVFGQLVMHDILSIFFPWVPKWGVLDADRGKTLQKQFKSLGVNRADLQQQPETTGDEWSPSFGDFMPEERDGTRPSLVFSPMLVETGVPMFLSNLNLTSIRDERKNASSGSVAFFDVFTHSLGSFHIATAIRMSATFPYLSPAVSLPTKYSRRVVDAGYYDNFGVNFIGQFLLNPEVRAWLIKNTSGVAVIQIRAFPKEEGKKASLLSRTFHFLTTPVQGTLKARTSMMSTRNDQLLRNVQKIYNEQAAPKATAQRRALSLPGTDPTAIVDSGRGFLRSYIFTNYDEKVSLNWYLPESEFRSLQRQIENHAAPAAKETAADVIARMADEWDQDWAD